MLGTTMAQAVPDLGGLKLGDTEDALKQISWSLKDISADAPGNPGTKAYKYTTETGDEVSVTFKDGKAVWIEEDWKGDPDADESLIKGLVFGKVSVVDLRTMLGSNGYAHRKIMFHQVGDVLASFNCYGIADQPGTSIVFISGVSMGTDPDDIRRSTGQPFKLRSIVLATDDYLDTLWGPELNKDTTYHPVPWSSVDRQPSDAAVTALRHSVDMAASGSPTQEEAYSVVLPVGFHRIPSPHGDPNLYLFSDMADSRRMISLYFDKGDVRKRDASAYLADVMTAFSVMHTQFQSTEPVKVTVSGLAFTCSGWSGYKAQKFFGGRVCVAQEGDGHIMYSDLDFKHRYDDDATIYQQVFESLKLK